MKNTFLLILVFTFWIRSFATNYYLSSFSGMDSNSGTSPSSAWKTITKLNTVTYLPGDTVFFKRMEVFPGNIIVNQGGSVSAPLVFDTYGAGDLPVIIGSEDVTGWAASGNYYTASYTGAVNNFFVNGREQTLARYPNEHVYLTLDSAQTGYLRDASLSSLNSNLIAGSTLCIHSSQHSWEKTSVYSFSGDKITYSSALMKAGNEYGYFFFNNLQHLDTAMEWFYDATAHLLYYYPPAGINPNTKICSASVYRNGIEFGSNVSYVKITRYAFENQSNAGVQIGNASNHDIIVDGCYFSGQYNYGVNVLGKYCRISNSYFREIDGIAVYGSGTGGMHTTIEHNYLIKNGITRCSGLGNTINGTALMCISDSNSIYHNYIDSTGYCGILTQGAYNVVERNIVNHAVLIENDGGGIKAGMASGYSDYKSNFIANSNGNTEGTYQADFITPAIYFDYNVNHCTIANNTVYSQSTTGIFQNSSNHDNGITGNIIHGGKFLLHLNGTDAAPSSVPITGMSIKHNAFFSKDNNSVIIRQVDYTKNYNTGTLDSNYYFQPYSQNHYAERIESGTTYYTFPTWQATGNDPHTVKSFVSWTYPASYDTLFINPTDTVAIINLGADKFLDLDSNTVCGTITLQPYTSKILINTNTTCPMAITEYNGAQPIQIYPNPVTNEIRIASIRNISGVFYRVVDVFGKSILEGNMNSENTPIYINKLSAGLYFLLLNGKTGYRQKFIKE